MEFNFNNVLDLFSRKPSIIKEAEKARFHPNWFLQMLIFVAVFFVTQVAAIIPLIGYMIYDAFSGTMNGIITQGNQAEYLATMQDKLTLPMLFCTAITAGIVIVYCRFIERRSLKSMGFVKEKRKNDYLFGLLVGFSMFSLCVAIAFLAGTLKFNGYVLGNGFGLLMLFVIGFMIQGAEEEIMMRGYVMVSMGARYSILLAIISNSVLFAALHLGNQGITMLAFSNLVLYGIFASVYTLKMDSLWGICAIHSAWNFAQGNLYGISVSGLDLKTSVFSFGLTEKGSLINGGSFGLEGGLAVTLVLIGAIILTAMSKGRNHIDNINGREEITSGKIAE